MSYAAGFDAALDSTVGGFVLLRYDREPRVQSFHSTSILRHLDGMKTSVARRIGRFV